MRVATIRILLKQTIKLHQSHSARTYFMSYYNDRDITEDKRNSLVNSTIFCIQGFQNLFITMKCPASMRLYPIMPTEV